jgi:hypothetical protein
MLETASYGSPGSLTIICIAKPLDHRGNTLYDEDVAPALQLPTHPSG